MTFADDRERSPTDPYLRGPALWARMIVWAFVIVPWWVLVVFRPVQDARMLWRVMTRPAEAGTTIAGWLVQSYGHVLPIWPWPRPHPTSNTVSPEDSGAPTLWNASGALSRLFGSPIRCRPSGKNCR